MEKPKLTKEQAIEIYSHDYDSYDEFKDTLIRLGYMEKPETALERAERLFDEWGRESSQDPDEENKIIGIVDAFRDSIKELKEKIEKLEARK